MPEELFQSDYHEKQYPNSNNSVSLNICCLALTNQQSAIVMLIDLMQSVVLGTVNLQFSVALKILDLAFLPNSTTKFASCGHQHLAVWSLKGESLSYVNYEIMTPGLMKRFINEQEESEAAQKKLNNNNKNIKVIASLF